MCLVFAGSPVLCPWGRLCSFDWREDRRRVFDTMKVQLLLLLALVGLLCAFTSASPTAVPTVSTQLAPEENTPAETAAVEMTVDSFTILTTWISPIPTTVPAQSTTKVFTEFAAVSTTPALTEAEAPSTANTEGPTETETPAETEDPGTEAPAETEGPTESEDPGTEDPSETEGPGTEAPAETEGPTETEDPGMEGASKMDKTERETNGEMIIDNGTEDGLSSGQIVSIVVGALLAVAVTAAVVIVVVRRMGKYSP